jgi:hypothetical protein
MENILKAILLKRHMPPNLKEATRIPIPKDTGNLPRRFLLPVSGNWKTVRKRAGKTWSKHS